MKRLGRAFDQIASFENLYRAWRRARRGDAVLRGDVRRYFPSIHHEVLKTTLRTRLKDHRLLDLLDRIVDHGAPDGRGLPIGSLASQWFATLYLDPFDRWVRHERNLRGYVRYMDDFALVSGSMREARAHRSEAECWLREHLRLELKPGATQIYRARDGWPFLGFRILPHAILLRRTTRRRSRKRLGALWHEHRRGRLTAEELAERATSVLAHVARARDAVDVSARLPVGEA